MLALKIKVVDKDKFRKILLDLLVNDADGWTIENVFDGLLEDGFAKLDFDRLNDCLSKMPVYVSTIGVDFGDPEFIWIVSGRAAILVHK
jgi:hypothetical protein